ncbi:MAG TPA: response regulator [Vicinamibacterales bacterium]|jgi:hypothetical protein
MTDIWMTIVLAHPVATASAILALVSAAWGLHLWRLRLRERDLLLLVDQRTRQWQDEASAHTRLRERIVATVLAFPLHAASPVSSAGGERACETGSARVLVVDDRAEERVVLASLFDGLGVTAAFADSEWAASVARMEACEAGMPYDLVLVGAGMPAAETDGISLPEAVDSSVIERLLACCVQSDRRPAGLAAAPSGGGAD